MFSFGGCGLHNYALTGFSHFAVIQVMGERRRGGEGKGGGGKGEREREGGNGRGVRE